MAPPAGLETKRRRRQQRRELRFRIRYDAHPVPDSVGFIHYRVWVGFGSELREMPVNKLDSRRTIDQVVDWLTRPGRPPRNAAKKAEPRIPLIQTLLYRAKAWQQLLDTGDAESLQAIAEKFGTTRQRVKQVTDLLRLAKPIQRYILRMGLTWKRSPVTERALRPILAIENTDDQLHAFEGIVGAEVVSLTHSTLRSSSKEKGRRHPR